MKAKQISSPYSPLESEKWRLLNRYFKYREMNLETWAQEYSGKRDKIVVHIPARSGSKRLPKKNIALLNGLPLMAYTIRVAKALNVDRVIVNTDNEQFAEIARHYGAETPFIRPQELSEDHSPPGLASFYALRHLVDEGYGVRSMIEMYPTTPLRNVATLNRYIEAMKQYGIAMTCVAPEVHCGNIFSNGRHVAVNIDPNREASTVYFKPISIFMGQNILASERPGYAAFPITNPLELTDIDSPKDLELAEYILRNNLYDFGGVSC